MTCTLAGLPSTQALAAPEQIEPSAFEDEDHNRWEERFGPLPRRHRFRLGLQTGVIPRLSTSTDDSGGEQRFHMVPLEVEVAYQLQFVRVLMVRPSFAVGGNVGNTLEAMPLLLHPQLHAGYQGRLLGAALGYGYIAIPIAQKDVTSSVRGGLPRPIITNNHQLDVEVSVTSRIHRKRKQAPGAGALSIALRLGAVRSHLRHLERDDNVWRFTFMINAGWYFGDGSRAQRRGRAKVAR